MNQGVNVRQVFIGFNVLILGALFYYFFRSAEHTYLLKFFGNTLQQKHILPPLFVTLGNSLPTFVHVIAFTLLTAGFVTNRKERYAIVCLSWFVIDVLFELAQGLDNFMIQFIPDWFSGVLFLENTRNYFLYGRFDYFDLLSIALGSLVAYILLVLTSKKEEGERRCEKNCL